MESLNPHCIPLHGRQLIEASAGTGKTYTITTLYLRAIVESHLDVANVLVVTFTRAATDELRNRIRERLHHAWQALQTDPAETDEWQWLREIAKNHPDAEQADGADALEKTRWRLQKAILEMDTAAIYTIHGFCQRALQDHAFDSGVLFDTTLEQDTSRLLQQACQEVWRERFYKHPILAHTAFELGYQGPDHLRDILKGYLNKTDLQLPEFNLDIDGIKQQSQTLKQHWQNEGHDALDLLREAAQAKIISASAKNYGPATLDALQEQMDVWSGLEDALSLPKQSILLTQSYLNEQVLKAAVKKGLDAPQHPLFEAVESYLEYGEQLAPWLLVTLLKDVRSAFSRLKQQRQVLGFDDLITRLREAVKGPLGDQLCNTLRQRYPLAMIDEFQDTDPAQYAIFNAVYPADQNTCGLLMIGDPKQAIYSFRGADIYAYLQAKHDTPSRFTMDTNWRSHSQLVNAVNRLFMSNSNAFLMGQDIEFYPVKAAGHADASPLMLNDKPVPPLQCWMWNREADEQKKSLDKKQVVPVIAATIASEISQWINLGQVGQARLGDKPLQPGDIAILVRKGTEALELQTALQECNVSSVFLSRESVYQTIEAEDLFYLMQALLEPTDESRLRAALVTHSWGYNANRLETLARDERSWEKLLHELLMLRQDWQRHGFMVMFQRWLHQYQIPARLLSRPQGDRALTNLLHLASLLQAAQKEAPTPESLCIWFVSQREGAGGQQDEHQLRLESDDDLVKIVTIHSSKGLEYPLVYCPYIALGSNWPSAPFCIHDPNQDFQLVMDFGDREQAQTQANLESLAEDLRLLYVAMTRAKQHCVFPWGAFKQMQNTALAWLLYGAQADTANSEFLPDTKQYPSDDEGIFAPLIQLSEIDSGIACLPMPEPGYVRQDGSLDNRSLAALAIKRPVQQRWFQSSYSQLAQYSHDERVTAATTRAEELGEEETIRPEEAAHPIEKSLLSFAAGSLSGLCLHSILEHIDFAEIDPSVHDEVIARQLDFYRLYPPEQTPDWTLALRNDLWKVLNTPLVQPDSQDRGSFCLHQIPASDRIVEMEFFLSFRDLQARRINDYLQRFWNDDDNIHLDFANQSGQLHGFIDLIFMHEGRFYLADYKSNKLGDSASAYDQEAMTIAIREHRYDLQLLIYSLALHRYLEARLPDYDYDTHFGGAYYLFLRGMTTELFLKGETTENPDNIARTSGVYFHRPTRAALEEFRTIVQGEAS
ncbi:exodeoxyribonuclease V subunit beta [Hahella sp. CCB-MM4]|uniref:exodeoxyribonuclease V subunit beta n=1 Tax=Hahella sp. (strain CCB-MM4) TaxID=1926491 RepID=UPI000B9A8D67|nr:exodeoxyribonuclease V subunit beta [Hahella sp. CCB-MM4]OZG74667.1 exodeoxyribonuclease V subunit beta [Hahella sp. CCB-MM4]